MTQPTLQSTLNTLLANTYALYLKTQSYHWHITGPQFYSYHQLLESQYTNLATAIDEIAERIVILGSTAIADFTSYAEKNTCQNANPTLSATAMLSDLYNDHQTLAALITTTIKQAQASSDEVTVGLLAERLAWHEKTSWMLKASTKTTADNTLCDVISATHTPKTKVKETEKV